MRFRKARSFLSAYCSGELTGRKQEKVREQLARNESLRREEALFKSIKKACQELPQEKVSDDFNARLLDRVARERFAETRTQAHMPKAAPAFSWWRAVPVTVTTVVVLFVAASLLVQMGQDGPIQIAADPGNLDNSYLTVQPDNNPNIGRGFGQQVSLPQLMAKVDRADEISNFLTGSRGFGAGSRTGEANWQANQSRSQTPYNCYHYTVRPVYRVTAPVTSKEGNGVY